MCLATTKYQWDRHIWDVPLTLLSSGKKIDLAAQVIFGFSSCTVKISILLFYRRMTGGVKNFLSVASLFWICIIGTNIIIYIFAACFQCK